ncbi:MAG: hypothetical protein K8T89_09020 [Planctomycetes bacterium]|nr:hypothetical protein [Planctomycetota bacterium]
MARLVICTPVKVVETDKLPVDFSTLRTLTAQLPILPSCIFELDEKLPYESL